MNRREKKKLRKGYIQKINSAISYKTELVMSEKSDTDRIHKEIELLKDIKSYVDQTDFRMFYEIYLDGTWPSVKSFNSFYFQRSYEKFKEDISKNKLFNREFSINMLLDEE